MWLSLVSTVYLPTQSLKWLDRWAISNLLSAHLASFGWLLSLLFLSVAAVGWSRCVPDLARSCPNYSRFKIGFPFTKSLKFSTLLSNSIFPHTVSTLEPPRRWRWGRQSPGLRAENSNTWWRRGRRPSDGTHRRARWTLAWATPVSSLAGTSKFSRLVKTAPVAGNSTSDASAKTGCLWMGCSRDEGLHLCSSHECKMGSILHFMSR